MRKYSQIKIAALAIILATGCTKLDETPYGRLSPGNYYTTQAEALTSVAAIYSNLSTVEGVSSAWTISEEGSDELVIPGRASGGWFDQGNIDIMQHNVNATNGAVSGAWTSIFNGVIGLSNAVLVSLQGSPIAANLKAEIAETRALRAYGYFYALDFWGNVPIVTAPVEAGKLPETSPRAEVFKFVEAEMIAAAADLPSATTVNKTTYYPRLTKEAVYTALATLYLNAEVYTGTAKWNEAITMCNNVINTGAFGLEANVVDNFKPTNEGKTRETIFAFAIDPSKNVGSNAFILYTQPQLDQKRYNLPFAPANGFSTFIEALNRYEDRDNRKKLLQYGPQFYADGRPLVDDKGVQLNIVNVTSYTAALEPEGFKVLKYVPEGVTWSGPYGDNDLVLTRYSDVLLTKAEASFRAGNAGDALTLINQVRNRSNATPLTAVTLKNLEEERAREFIWEGHRRRDMIRFGTFFNTTWTFKTTISPQWKGLYPIPAREIATNPKLKQNPNYN